jgi:hypothetical protein
VQAAAAAPSRLQATLVGEPVVVNATLAEVEFRNAPFAGDVIVTVGIALTVKLVVAEPVLPATSVAVTTMVWAPAARPVYDTGLVQDTAAAASSLQVRLATEVVASVAVKLSVTELPCVEPLAGDEIATTGATVSTMKQRVAVAVPAPFVTVIVMQCDPSERAGVTYGDVQFVAAPESIEQVTLVGLPVTVNASETFVEASTAPSAGDVIVTVGRVVATENVTDFVFGLPAASVATTVMVWLPSASPLYVVGLVQAAAAAASSLQVVVTASAPAVKFRVAELVFRT